MDPVSHLLFGGTLAYTVKKRKTRGLTAALILGSIFPDIDVLLAARGFDVYLSGHATGTHSLAGAIVEAPILALALSYFVRGSRFARLTVASVVGILGHIVWDLADGSDIALFSPYRARTFGWHLVSMGDPIVLTALAVAVAGGWFRPRRAASFALAGIAALTVLLSAKAASQAAAVARYQSVVTAPPAAAEITPVRGSLFDWIVYDQAGERVRAWSVDAWSGAVRPLFDRPDVRASAVAAASKELPVVRRFLSLSKLPFARIEANGAHQTVLWSDARSCSPTGCDVSFGGAFDHRAMPLDQIIQIGGLVMRRPLAAGR